MNDSLTRARSRVEGTLVEVCQLAGIDPLPVRIVGGTRSASPYVGYTGDRDAGIVVSYPKSRALRDSQQQMLGALAHEVSHVTLCHVVRAERPTWTNSQLRIAVAMASTMLPIGVAAVWLLVLIFPWIYGLEALAGFGLGVVIGVFVLGAFVGALPWIIYLYRTCPVPPGWEGVSDREREFAADAAAVLLVGKGPLVATLERRVPRTRLGRFLERAVTDVVTRSINTHPSSESRVQAIAMYDGSEPRDYAQHVNRWRFRGAGVPDLAVGSD